MAADVSVDRKSTGRTALLLSESFLKHHKSREIQLKQRLKVPTYF